MIPSLISQLTAVSDAVARARAARTRAHKLKPGSITECVYLYMLSHGEARTTRQIQTAINIDRNQTITAAIHRLVEQDMLFYVGLHHTDKHSFRLYSVNKRDNYAEDATSPA